MSRLKKHNMKATNRVEPAKTNNHDWGNVVPGKGRNTLNASIDPHAMDKELKDLAKPDYKPEHERYLGQAMEVVK